MMLTDSPLDDYQRLCFKNSTCNVHTATYKSNLTPTMCSLLSHFNNNGGQPNMVKQDKLLNCFEYQFPDLITTHVESRDDLQSSENKQTQASFNNSTPSKGYDELDAKVDVSNVSGKGKGSSTTISKNQQFKLTNLNANHKVINNNNCILWTDFKQTDNKEDNFVFLTGIWRLYQDVMKGLIKTPRKSGDSQSRQNFCRQEYDFIISNCFCDDDTSVENDHKFHKRKSTGSAFVDGLPKVRNDLTTGASNNNNGNNNNTKSETGSQPNYVDFHWFDIPENVRYQIFNQFEKYLREERHVDTTNLPKFDEYIQRIRGGYIKIQGTWVPWYIAKLICLRFCFPIRYLLVPIFGEQFPKECEDYFFTTHMNNLNDFLKNEHTITTTKRRRKSTGLISPPSLRSSLNHKKNETHMPPFLSPGAHREQTHFLSIHGTGRRRSESNISPGTSSARLHLGRSPPIMEEPAYYDTTHDAGHYGMHSYSEDYVNPTAGNQNRKRSLSWSYSSPSKKQKLPPISLLLKSINWRSSQKPVVMESNPTVQTISKLASFYTTRGHKYSYPENIFTVNNTEEKIYTTGTDYGHTNQAYASPASTSSSSSPKNFKLGQLQQRNDTHYGTVPRNVPENPYVENTRYKVNQIHNLSDVYSMKYTDSVFQNSPKTTTFYSPVVHNE